MGGRNDDADAAGGGRVVGPRQTVVVEQLHKHGHRVASRLSQTVNCHADERQYTHRKWS